MIVECPNCESKVDSKVLSSHESRHEEFEPERISFVICPVCNGEMLVLQDYIQTGSLDYVWTEATRLWPGPDKFISGHLPDIVGNSLDQAIKCYKAKAYEACAVMCGRTIEGICAEFKTKAKTLGSRLKELLEKQIIDKRIYEWGEAVRIHRNIGAHATVEKITKEDARYLLDFAQAICEYVYILTEKFERFMKSKKKSEPTGSQSQ